jgi:predicted O-methyltransferase YrrM
MLNQTIPADVSREIETVERVVQQQDDALAIPRVSAEFIHTLVLAGGFCRALEIGTSYGWSGLWIGAALLHNGGTLVTIDSDARKTTAAQASFARAGLADTISVVAGTANDVLDELDGPFDFVFIDADKPNTRRYFDRCWYRLAQRATVVTDNAVTHADELADYLAHLRAHPNLCSTLVPIGSGLEVSVKLDPYSPTVSVDGADWVI